MPAVGKITVSEVGRDRIYTDESGQSYTIKGSPEGASLELDSRIDLTRPIYEQVMKLMARDRAAGIRKKSKRSSEAA